MRCMKMSAAETTNEKVLKIQTKSGKLFKDVDFFINSIGEPIHCRYWKPDGEPKALIMLLHGFGDHSGRYGAFATQLKEIGLLAFSNDHMNMGENPGNFDIVDYKQLVKDALKHASIMKEKHPDLPMYIFGHSMGGCVSVFAASQSPELFNGVILSAPMVKIDPQFTRFLVLMASTFKSVLPRLPVSNSSPDELTRDKEEIAKYAKDPLIYHGPVRLRAAYQLYLMSADVQSCFSTLNLPLLILHGNGDKVCDISGSQTLLSEAKTTDKKLRVFEGAKHALLYENENVPADFVAEVKSWISERLEVK